MTVRTGMSERVHPLFALLPCLCHPPGTFCCYVRRRCEREVFCWFQSPSRAEGWIRCAAPTVFVLVLVRSLSFHGITCGIMPKIWGICGWQQPNTRGKPSACPNTRGRLYTPTIRRSLPPHWRFLTPFCSGKPRQISCTPGRTPPALTRTGLCLFLAVARPLTWFQRLGRCDGSVTQSVRGRLCSPQHGVHGPPDGGSKSRYVLDRFDHVLLVSLWLHGFVFVTNCPVCSPLPSFPTRWQMSR